MISFYLTERSTVKSHQPKRFYYDFILSDRKVNSQISPAEEILLWFHFIWQKGQQLNLTSRRDSIMISFYLTERSTVKSYQPKRFYYDFILSDRKVNSQISPAEEILLWFHFIWQKGQQLNLTSRRDSIMISFYLTERSTVKSYQPKRFYYDFILSDRKVNSQISPAEEILLWFHFIWQKGQQLNLTSRRDSIMISFYLTERSTVKSHQPKRFYYDFILSDRKVNS